MHNIRNNRCWFCTHWLPKFQSKITFTDQIKLGSYFHDPLPLKVNSLAPLRSGCDSKNCNFQSWITNYTFRLSYYIAHGWMARDLNDVSIHSGNGLVSSGIQLLPESMLTQFHVTTVYPKKYAHGFCFAVLCCGYTLTDYPISIRLTSLALWQSNDCPSASKATLMNMDNYFMWIHYERLHNHNKAKHNKTVCIFLGIYCIWR